MQFPEGDAGERGVLGARQPPEGEAGERGVLGGRQPPEGGANGREGRAVRSSEQDQSDPLPAGGRGSLMARYRGAPAPGAEEQAPPARDTPTDPGSGPDPGGPADSPWRQSSWTPAPPVPPVPPPPAVPPPRPVRPVPASSSVLPPPAAPAEDAPGAAEAPQPADDWPARSSTQATASAPTRPAQSSTQATASAPTRPAESSTQATASAPTRPAESSTQATASAPARPADGASTTPAGGTPAVRADEPAGPAARGSLLTAELAREFRQRWRDLQTEFVDDPQQAVRGAGGLSREILQALSDTIADAERVDRWKAGDGTSATEDLRIALRRYRTLVDRLLDL